MLNKIRQNLTRMYSKGILVLTSKKGEGTHTNVIVVVLITVVVGALILALLYVAFKDTFIPQMVDRIQEMLNFKG